MLTRKIAQICLHRQREDWEKVQSGPPPLRQISRRTESANLAPAGPTKNIEVSISPQKPAQHVLHVTAITATLLVTAKNEKEVKPCQSYSTHCLRRLEQNATPSPLILRCSSPPPRDQPVQRYRVAAAARTRNQELRRFGGRQAIEQADHQIRHRKLHLTNREAKYCYCLP